MKLKVSKIMEFIINYYFFFKDEYSFNGKVKYLFNIDNKNKNYFVLRRIANLYDGAKKADTLYFCFFTLVGNFNLVTNCTKNFHIHFFL